MDPMGGRTRVDVVDEPPRWWTLLLVLLLVASIAMASVALVVQVADLDVDTRVGIVDFQLDTDWKVRSVTYTGTASEFGVDVEGEQVLLEGTGDFQEAVGFLKGTSKRVTNSITPYTSDFLGTRATLNVTTVTDTIPWWVVGVSTPCQVEVELIESMNVSSLTVDRVYLEFRREVDGEMLKKVVWSKDVNDALTNIGDKKTYKADLEVNEDWGEFLVFGMVEVTMVDADGMTATNVYRSYSIEPKVITLWTIPTMEGVRIALLIASFPVYLLGMVFAVGGAVAIVLNKKGRLLLPVIAAAILLLGALFFMMGVTQLADLVGFPDDLSFTTGFYIMFLGFVPAMVVGVLVAYEKHKYGGDEEEPAGADEVPTRPEQAVPSAENTNTDDNTVQEEDAG
ncbi:MAG: hypothetical protein KAQ96_00555 [Thermoplasmata archaeon]|nr:hypothetical protein [Thermoplasmata archaeon]